MTEVNPNLFVYDPTAKQAEFSNAQFAGTRAQAAQSDYADQIRQQAAKYQAGSQYAAGNYAGASQALAGAGDIQGAEQVRQTGQGISVAGQQYLAKALPALDSVAQTHEHDADGGASFRAQRFDEIAGEAQKILGANPQVMASVRQSYINDPQGTINRLSALVPSDVKALNGQFWAIRGNQATAITPAVPKFGTLAPGAVQVPENQAAADALNGGQQGAQGQAQPPAAQSATVGNGPAPNGAAPLGIRSNNPGNLMPGGHEAQFQNQTAGVLAASENLDAYGKMGINTVAGIINRWAPPNENNTAAYTNFVSQQLGVNPNQPLNLSDKNVKGHLLEAIFHYENGQQPQMPNAPQGAAPAQPQVARVGQPFGQPRPLWHPPTPDELKQYPGAVAMNVNGEPKYPPATVMAQAAGNSATLNAGDPTSKSILAQTGLSQGGFMVLTGNSSQLPRDAASRTKAQKEAEMFANQHGVDVSTLQSQFKAYNNTVQTNVQKSNALGTLGAEVQGTVNNLAPVADKLKGSDLRWSKAGVAYLGGLQNDPNAQQYALYLNQLRADLAGFNAVSGGKMDNNGNAHADDSDFRAAESVIKDGLNSGGAKGLAQAIAQTEQKNRAIVDQKTAEARRNIWGLFGVGQNFDKVNGTGAPAPKKIGRFIVEAH